MNTAKLYWDEQDANNAGYSLRYYDASGNEQHAAISGEQDADVAELLGAVVKETSYRGPVRVIRSTRFGFKVQDLHT